MNATESQTTLDPDDRRMLDAVSSSLASTEGNEPDCTVINRRLHRGSVNLELHLRTDDGEREVFVKRLREASSRRYRDYRADAGRPRLKPVPDPVTKLHHEAEAMEAVHAMVTDDGRDDWFAVGVVADLPGVLVLERHACPTFAELAASGDDDDLLHTAVPKLGRWLRAFHRMPDLPHTRPHLATRAEVEALLSDLLDHVDCTSWDDSAVRGQISLMLAGLPDDLPTVLGHADFAAHNVFVDGAGRVAVFDTSADHRLPPHLDLAYFAVLLEFADLRRIRPRLRARTSSQAFREGLLSGYGEAPPESELRLFEIAVLLDKWSSLLDSDKGSRLRRLAKRVRRRLLVRRLRSAVEDRLRGARPDA